VQIRDVRHIRVREPVKIPQVENAYFQAKPDDLPKSSILLDPGYHSDTLTEALPPPLTHLPMRTKVQVQLSPKVTQAEKAV